MNAAVLFACLLFSTLIFIIFFGKSAAAKNLRIFIFMAVRTISEKMKRLRTRDDQKGG